MGGPLMWWHATGMLPPSVGLPSGIMRSTSAGREDQVLPQSRSDGAVMDVAPKGAWTAALQWTGDGVVGFFVVGFGVLVW